MKNILQIIQKRNRIKSPSGISIFRNCGVKRNFEAAQKLNLPVIIGLSEGEQNFWDKNAALMVKIYARNLIGRFLSIPTIRNHWKE